MQKVTMINGFIIKHKNNIMNQLHAPKIYVWDGGKTVIIFVDLLVFTINW